MSFFRTREYEKCIFQFSLKYTLFQHYWKIFSLIFSVFYINKRISITKKIDGTFFVHIHFSHLQMLYIKSYNLKISLAVLSGICASPTEQDTVIIRFPCNIPWLNFRKQNALIGILTFPFFIPAILYTSPCKYFRPVRCPVIFLPLIREISCISLIVNSR